MELQPSKFWHVKAKRLLISAVAPLLFLGGCFSYDVYLLGKARPPKSVVDVHTFLQWRPNPMRVYEITVGTNIFYQLTGPAGRFWASGPAGYAFDSEGKFIGRSKDIGDFKVPKVVYSGGTKRSISLASLTNAIHTNPVAAR